MRVRTTWLAALVCAALAAGGCAEGMIPTPYVMRGGAGRAMFEKTAERLRTPEVPIVYVTDRAVAREGGAVDASVRRHNGLLSLGERAVT